MNTQIDNFLEHKKWCGYAQNGIYDCNCGYNESTAELRALRSRVEQAERVEKIASIIYDVTSTGFSIRTAKACPHGNYATPPHNHSWWCDDCWLELKDALAAKDGEK